MNLFLDTISPNNVLLLFNNERQIIKKYFFDVRLNESTRLIEELHSFLERSWVWYNDLENIVVVNGPGSFTGVRTTVLLVNTINYTIKKHITTLTYFDLFHQYPIIKASSKRDSFIKLSKNDEIQIMENEVLKNMLLDKNISKIYWDINIEWLETESSVDYDAILQNIVFQDNDIVSAFYCKKPNIS